jgi:carboxymethylenebutenolidase
MGQRQITAADGFTFSTYEALPAGRPKGAVVVIQEIFGVNAHIRSVADGYAKDGYVALAPALFDRVERNVELGYTDPDEFQKGIRLAFQDLRLQDALQDLQATVNAGAAYGKVGVVGYCFGGLLTWLSACELNGVAAASSYYGGGIAKQLERQPKCPIIMHFGERDMHIPMSEVEALRTAHPGIPVHVYAADHGFNCDTRASYDAASATLARQRTLELFSAHL